MRVTIQQVLGLSDKEYEKYLNDCKENEITPLNLVDDLSHEEYAKFCKNYESRCFRSPPRQWCFDYPDAEKIHAQQIEKKMMDYAKYGLFSRHLTEQESRMYKHMRLKVIDYYRKREQNPMLQQQVQYVPSPAMSNSGSNWLGQSIGESAAGFDF
jgi:hypothetical protein